MKYFHAGYSGDCSYCVYAVVIQEEFWEQKSRIEEGVKDEKRVVAQINDVNAIGPKLYKHIYYMNNQIHAVFLFSANMDYYAYRSRNSVKGSYQVEAESTAQSTQAAGEAVTLTIGIWSDDESMRLEKAFEGIEEDLGIKIDFLKYPSDSDFWDNIPAQIAAGTARL